MNSTPEYRAESIRAAIVSQVADLLERHYEEIVKAAEQNFQNDDAAGEIEGKVVFAVSFLPAVQSPEVSVKASWSVRYSDECEEQIDPEQEKLPLENVDRPARKVRDLGLDLAGRVVLFERLLRGLDDSVIIPVQ